MTGRRSTGATRERGMALIVVLWLIVLLSVMASGHARNTRTDTRLAARQVETAKARALAEAGINHVILAMLADADAAIPADGRRFTLRIRERAVTLSVRNATGLVNLNRADSALLDAALSACDIDAQERLPIVDAILDWRDADGLAHLHGFEDDDYRAAGVTWTARDGAFRSVEELRYLPGVDPARYDCLAPLVTVVSHSAGVDLEYAPPALLRALAGDEVPAEPIAEEQTPSGTTGAGTFYIYASAAGNGNVTAAIEAVVNVSRSAAVPFRVLAWRESPAGHDVSATGDEA